MLPLPLRLLPPRPKPKSCACEPSRPWIDRLGPPQPQVLQPVLPPAPAGERAPRPARKVRVGGPVVAVCFFLFFRPVVSSLSNDLCVDFVLVTTEMGTDLQLPGGGTLKTTRFCPSRALLEKNNSAAVSCRLRLYLLKILPKRFITPNTHNTRLPPRTLPVAPGKAAAKKGDATAGGSSGAGGGGGGVAGARRANVSELKGLVEVRAACQAARGGAGAVTAEGRPLLRVGCLLSVCCCPEQAKGSTSSGLCTALVYREDTCATLGTTFFFCLLSRPPALPLRASASVRGLILRRKNCHREAPTTLPTALPLPRPISL